MSTNYPTSVDILANPDAAAGNNLNTAGLEHDRQHQNANDAIEAIEGFVGPQGAPAGAGTLVGRIKTLEAGGGVPGPTGATGAAGPTGATGPTGPAGGGGGGGGTVTTTIAGITALQSGGTLVVGTEYIVTDWTTPNALPGPNFLYVQAVATDKLSEDVGVYCTINATDPILGAYTGPIRGKYLWDGLLPGMYYLESTLGNKVSDLTGGTVIDAIPWDTYAISENVIDNVTFTGGYAAMAALFAGGLSIIIDSHLVSGTLNVSASAGFSVSIMSCELMNSNLILGGSVNFQDCHFGRGVKIDLSGKPSGDTLMYSCNWRPDSSAIAATQLTYYGAGTLNMYSVDVDASVISVGSDAIMNWSNVTIGGHSNVQTAAGSRGLNMTDVQLLEGTVLQNRSGGVTNVDWLRVSQITGALTLDGAVDPGGTQFFDGLRVFLGQVNVTDPSNTGTPVNSVHIDNGFLVVQAGGAAGIIRIFGNATLNTGAFSHQQVDISGGGTYTLTAANTGTYRGFGANTLV